MEIVKFDGLYNWCTFCWESEQRIRNFVKSDIRSYDPQTLVCYYQLKSIKGLSRSEFFLALNNWIEVIHNQNPDGVWVLFTTSSRSWPSRRSRWSTRWSTRRAPGPWPRTNTKMEIRSYDPETLICYCGVGLLHRYEFFYVLDTWIMVEHIQLRKGWECSYIGEVCP